MTTDNPGLMNNIPSKNPGVNESAREDIDTSYGLRPMSEATRDINHKLSGKFGVQFKGLDEIYKFIVEKTKDGEGATLSDIKQHLDSQKISIEDIHLVKFIKLLLYDGSLPYLAKHIFIDSLDIENPVDIFAANDEPDLIKLLFSSYDEKSCNNIVLRETDGKEYLNPQAYIKYIQESIKNSQFINTYLVRGSLKKIRFKSEFDTVPEEYSKRYRNETQLKKTNAIKESIYKQLSKNKEVFYFNNLALPQNENLRLARARYLIKLLIFKIAPMYAKQTSPLMKEINKENVEKGSSIDPGIFDLAKIIRTEANKEEKPLKKQITYIAHELLLTQNMLNSLMGNLDKKDLESSFQGRKEDIANWGTLGYFEIRPTKKIIEELNNDEDIIKIKGLTGKNLKNASHVQYYFHRDNFDLVLENEKSDFLKTKDSTRLTVLIKYIMNPDSGEFTSREQVVLNIIELLVNEDKSLIGKIFDPIMSIFRNKKSYLMSKWKEIRREYEARLKKKLKAPKPEPQKSPPKKIIKEAPATIQKEELKITVKDAEDLDIIKKILVDNFKKVEQKNIKEPEKSLPPTLDDYAELLEGRIKGGAYSGGKEKGVIKQKFLNYINKYFFQIAIKINIFLIPKSYNKNKLTQIIRNYEFLTNYASRKGNQEVSDTLKALATQIEEII